jgi:hypothetical protein
MPALAAVAACQLILSSCGVGCIPIPVSRNIARAPGVEQTVPKLDGVKIGVTTRKELEGLVGPFLTVASDKRFLWARWEQVSFPVGCWRGKADRDWERMNVLAVADERGVLKQYRRCPEKVLLDCLAQMSGAWVPTPAEPEVMVSHSGFWASSPSTSMNLAVDAGGLHIQERDGSRKRSAPPKRYEVAPTDIKKLEIKNSGYPQAVDVRFEFRSGVLPVRDFTTYAASPSFVWNLVGYLHAANPGLFVKRSG